MKKYLTIDEAICFLEKHSSYGFNSQDFGRLVVLGEITPIFYYAGSLAFYDQIERCFSLTETFRGYLIIRDCDLMDRILIKKNDTSVVTCVNVHEKIQPEDKEHYLMSIDEHGNRNPIRRLNFYDPFKGDLRMFDVELFQREVNNRKNAIDYTVHHTWHKLTRDDLLFDIDGLQAFLKKGQDIIADVQNPQNESITTLQAIGIMAELLAGSSHQFRKGENNVNAKAIGIAVAARAKIRFGADTRGFDAFNKKVSDGLKALEKIEKK